MGAREKNWRTAGTGNQEIDVLCWELFSRRCKQEEGSVEEVLLLPDQQAAFFPQPKEAARQQDIII
jgi:hypothetical protein